MFQCPEYTSTEKVFELMKDIEASVFEELVKSLEMPGYNHSTMKHRFKQYFASWLCDDKDNVSDEEICHLLFHLKRFKKMDCVNQ